MELRLETARDGSAFCSADQRCLHSPYAPAREAVRYLDTKKLPPKPGCILLVGPCLNYLGQELYKRFPDTRQLCIQLSPFFRGKELYRSEDSWYPDSRESLRAFLEARISEDDISGLAIMDWPPAAALFADETAAVSERLRSFLDRLASSAATTKAFGQRWLGNACRSFLLAERLVLPPRRSGMPVLIAAAGPSLDTSLGLVRRFRGRFFLVASSSALEACLAAACPPDLVLTTEAGFWSRPHLYPLSWDETLRGSGSETPHAAGIPIAAAPSALPSAALAPMTFWLPLDQGFFAEAPLLSLLGARALRIQPHGTVSGSALSLAAQLSEGPILFAGLDLAARAEQGHARPHAFDRIVSLGAKRLGPQESAAWQRRSQAESIPLGNQWYGSRSMSLYAKAIAEDARAFPGRLYRLLPSPQEVPGLIDIGSQDDAKLEAIFPMRALIPSWESYSLPPRIERESALKSLIAAWRSQAMAAATMLGRGALPASETIVDLFRCLDLPDWAAARRAALGRADPALAAQRLAARVDAILTELGERLCP